VGFERVEQVHHPSHHLAVCLLTVGGDVWNMERLSCVWSRLGGPGPGEGVGNESIQDELGNRGGV
jgi:hypothetical protein